MAEETILQHWLVTQFILPFVLIFALVYAVLEKTKLFGDDKHQINAIVAGVLGLIFVSVISPKLIVENMILFLTVAIVIVFVVLLLWGFVSGSELKTNILSNKAVKWIVGIALIIAVIIALLWASGISGNVYDALFRRSWSSEFWTNAIFIIVAGAALAVVLRSSKNN
jgi:hypothetical protein